MKDDKIKTPSLYELTDDFKALMDFGYDAETEEAFLDTLDGILGGIQDKADGYCAVISRFKGNVDMIKAEENRLKARREVIEHNIDRMKDALKRTLEAMEESGIEKPEIKTDLHTIKLAGNGGKQPLKIDEENVPDSYKVVIYQTDSDRIQKELEEGKELPFAHLEPRGRHVSSK